MDFIDYYKILRIEKTATEANIKKAYRKLAETPHPYLNPKDKEANKKFKAINKANELLSGPEKRKKYDLFGKYRQQAVQYEQQVQQQRSRPGGQEFTGTGEGDFSSFPETMFGGSEYRRQTQYQGQDYNTELTLSLIYAMEIHQQIPTVNGKNIRITIPAGIENGKVIKLKGIKLKGYGSPGVNGGPAGNLYITFNILSNANFKRLGNYLFTKATIDLYTALLGGETTIETLKGKVKLKVNPETQNGTKIRLKGKGFPVYKKEGEAGDLYVSYEIQLPTNLTEEQKILFTELSKLK
jgi:curved DNA-binding protein